MQKQEQQQKKQLITASNLNELIRPRFIYNRIRLTDINVNDINLISTMETRVLDFIKLNKNDC